MKKSVYVAAPPFCYIRVGTIQFIACSSRGDFVLRLLGDQNQSLSEADIIISAADSGTWKDSWYNVGRPIVSTAKISEFLLQDYSRSVFDGLV